MVMRESRASPPSVHPPFAIAVRLKMKDWMRAPHRHCFRWREAGKKERKQRREAAMDIAVTTTATTGVARSHGYMNGGELNSQMRALRIARNSDPYNRVRYDAPSRYVYRTGSV
ncbi:hypothetical protein K438DRAFT_1785124 [Mycena galopus ATCC 62051]|nr:hypothetical protein K438DRAFT_1785124 [Mycena galopus ATCC 62051]